MTEKLKQWDGAVEIPLDKLELDPRNPNVMSDVKFRRLVTRIEEFGFDEPIQVIPHPEHKDMFQIVGGEHRYKAAKLLEMPTIPAVIKECLSDEKTRYEELMARNIDRGDLDAVKFNKLLNHLKELDTNLDTKVLAENMGFESQKELEKYVKEEQKRKNTQVENAADADPAKKKVQIVDNVSYILSEVMNKFGETAPMGYIFFCYKNRMHLMVQCDKDLYQLTHDVSEGLKRDNTEINKVLKSALESIKESGGFGQVPVDYEYEPSGDDDLDDLESPGNLLK